MAALTVVNRNSSGTGNPEIGNAIGKPARERRPGAFTDSCADDYGSGITVRCIQKGRDIRRIMLPVTVQGHHRQRSMLQGKTKARGQGAALAEMGRASQRDEREAGYRIECSIDRSVVYQNDEACLAEAGCSDGTQRPGFVPRRNHDGEIFALQQASNCKA